MTDLEQELRAVLQERVDAGAPAARALGRKARRAIHRRRLVLVTSAVAVMGLAGAAVATVVDLDRFPRPLPAVATPAPPRPAEGTNHDLVWDGDVAFTLRRMDCGSGSVGDESTPGLDHPGNFCYVGLGVVNETPDDLLLPVEGHRLVAGDEVFDVWRKGMDELSLDDPGSPFRTAIPPGGGALVSLYFLLPTDLMPAELELHAAAGSSGAQMLLRDCSFLRYEGRVSGGCHTNGPREAEPEVSYPYVVARSGGESPFQVTCFDLREWEVVDPASAAPAGYVGQGTMTLVEEDRAVFLDNSGAILTLRPTENRDTCH